MSETVLETARRLATEAGLDNMTNTDLETVIWEQTGYPEFWNYEDGATPQECFEAQLRRALRQTDHKSNLAVFADEVRQGDEIEWCGRWLRVLLVNPDRSRKPKRWGRLFLVEIDGAQHRLHYFDTEKVQRRAGKGSDDVVD